MTSSRAESGNNTVDEIKQTQSNIGGAFNGNDGNGTVMGYGNVVVNVQANRGWGLRARDQEPREASRPYWMVPYSRNKAFTGRKSILEFIEGFCQSKGHNRVALQGLGGCGKTQLALEYVYRRAKESNCSVFWVQGSEELKFREGFQAIARQVRIPAANAEDGQEEILYGVKRWFEDCEGGDWILVLDNVDNDTDFENSTSPIAKFVPQGRAGTVVFTTRSRLVAVRQCSQIIEVGKMTAEEAWELFAKRYGNWGSLENSDEETRVVAKVLHAVAGLAAFMTENSTLPSAYWRIFQKEDKRISLLSQEFSDIHRGADMTGGILGTYFVTFRQIERQTPAAAQLLQLIAVIDRQNIPEELLTRSGLEGMDDPLKFRLTIGKLLRFSLVTEVKHEDATFYELHRLVQLSIESYLSKEEAKTWRTTALRVISRLFPGYSYQRRYICAAYMSHALVLTKGLTDSIAEDLSYRMGEHFIEMGSYISAEIQIRRCIALREADRERKWAGKGYSRTRLLGMALRGQGRVNEAEIMFRKVAREAEELFGSEHPEALKAFGDLALSLQAAGRYRESEAMNRRAVEGYERVFGPDHSGTLWAVRNLALVLRSQGQYKESEMMNRRALLGCQKASGPDDADTLWAVHNLGLVLQDQGKYEESERMKRRALAWYEQSFGSNHPMTLMAVGNLASLLEGQGRYDEAESMNRRALEGYEKTLGSHHLDTLWAVNSLAVIFRGQGRYDESEAMNRRALEGYEKSLGLDHPNTLMALGNLASALEGQGRYEESELINRKALEGHEKALGSEHPDTLTAASNLATVLRHQGLYIQSETMNRRALEGYEKTLGSDHHYTFMAVNNLAIVMRDQGRYKESEPLNLRAVEGYTKACGPDHPNTLTAVNNLAILLQEQGRYTEAETLFRDALVGSEKSLGIAHPRALATLDSLALVLERQGKYKEAEGLLQRGLQARQSVLGSCHPDICHTLERLASVHETQGQYPRAKEALALAWKGWSETHGEQHPTTLKCSRRLALLGEGEEVTNATDNEGLIGDLPGWLLGYFG